MRPRIVLVLVLALPIILAAQSRKTVWSGVFTAAQAERGKTQFTETCSRCHGANLDGVQDANLLGDFAPRVSIRGTDFMERWREDTAHSLLQFIRSGMPPRTDPTVRVTPLPDQSYLDIVAYIFQANGFPAGDLELGSSDLRYIRIQEKDGPKPLATFTRIQVVGCLIQFQPGVWQLDQAGEPMRIRELRPPNEEETEASQSEPLGPLSFDLQNIGYLGRTFSPVEHEGAKMQARGILIRQPGFIRIDVRSLVELSPTCP